MTQQVPRLVAEAVVGTAYTKSLGAHNHSPSDNPLHVFHGSSGLNPITDWDSLTPSSGKNGFLVVAPHHVNILDKSGLSLDNILQVLHLSMRPYHMPVVSREDGKHTYNGNEIDYEITHSAITLKNGETRPDSDIKIDRYDVTNALFDNIRKENGSTWQKIVAANDGVPPQEFEDLSDIVHKFDNDFKVEIRNLGHRVLAEMEKEIIEQNPHIAQNMHNVIQDVEQTSTIYIVEDAKGDKLVAKTSV